MVGAGWTTVDCKVAEGMKEGSCRAGLWLGIIEERRNEVEEEECLTARSL